MLPKNTSSFAWLKITLFLLMSLGIWQAGAQSANAQTWTICQTGGCDFNNIQTAVNSAMVQDNDTLSFTVNRETYGPFTLTNKALTFEGNSTEIDAGNSSTAVIINGNKTVSFNDFSILTATAQTAVASS